MILAALIYAIVINILASAAFAEQGWWPLVIVACGGAALLVVAAVKACVEPRTWSSASTPQAESWTELANDPRAPGAGWGDRRLIGTVNVHSVNVK